jgi:hypothetical protein
MTLRMKLITGAMGPIMQEAAFWHVALLSRKRFSGQCGAWFAMSMASLPQAVRLLMAS